MNLKDFIHSRFKAESQECSAEEIAKESNWSLCEKKHYKVKIMRADSKRCYNANTAGTVYNYLEDAFEPANEGSFIVEGTKGELWVISESRLSKYNVPADDIGFEPVEASTIPDAEKYYFIRIPNTQEFTLDCNKISLKGNRCGIEHGSGDCLVTSAEFFDNEYRMPGDISDMWVVNGEVFNSTYKII